MALALSHGFAGVFSHLQGAVRETRLRPSRCLHERCGIATNATANPWRRACGRAASRPATERGPVLFLALLRLAVIFRSDGISVILWFRGRVLSLARCRSRDSP